MIIPKLKQKIKNFKVRVNIAQAILLDFLNIRPLRNVNTFIVGTQKGGTSAIYNYLSKSPEVSGGHRKEIGFFSREQIGKRGEHWYKRQFSKSKKNAKILIDATPEYLYYPLVPELLYNYNPDAKIIILLRNPVSRAYSHYNMFKNIHNLPKNEKDRFIKRFHKSATAQPMLSLINRENFPKFIDIIKEEVNNIESLEPSFIRRGYYYEQIKRYLEFFPNEQILILESSTLRENKRSTLKKICSFLNISSVFVDVSEVKNKHVGKYSEKMLPEDETYLKNHYKEYNEKLFRLINKRYDW